MFAYGRTPRRGERFDLVLSAKEPKAGSYELWAILKDMPWLLPVVQEFVVSGGVDAIYRFSSFVFSQLGGRKGDAQMHLNAMLELNRQHLEARNQSDQEWRATLLEVVDRLAPAARQAVKPMGNSASEMTLEHQERRLLTKIDEPMADAIRSKEDDEVGDMEEMRLKVDGIIHHSRQLKIISPENEKKFITAEVRDPVFDQVPNVYSEAAANKGEVTVKVKPVYRNSELLKVYIMDLSDG